MTHVCARNYQEIMLCFDFIDVNFGGKISNRLIFFVSQTMKYFLTASYVDSFYFLGYMLYFYIHFPSCIVPVLYVYHLKAFSIRILICS